MALELCYYLPLHDLGKAWVSLLSFELRPERLTEAQRGEGTRPRSHSKQQGTGRIRMEASPEHFFFFFLGPYLQHMEVPRLGVESELQLLTYTTAHSNAGPLTH